jgi:hypothetical protein
MIYPDRCVDQHIGLPGSAATPPRRGRQLALGATKRGKASSTFARNQGFETRPHDSGFLIEATQFSGFAQQYLVYDQSSSHMHEYGRLMHIRQPAAAYDGAGERPEGLD